MKIYFENENNLSLIMPTILLDALNALKIIRPPLSRKEVYKEIIEDFSDQPFADSLDSIDKLLKDESD